MEKLTELIDKQENSKERPQSAATESQPWDKTELELEEYEAAILNARRAKYFKQQTADYWKTVDAPEVTPKFSAEELQVWMQSSCMPDGKTFVIDDENREAVRLLCLYFTSDERFEKEGEGYSLSKGILLQGPVGVGKSAVMGHLVQNQKQCFKMVNCLDVTADFVNQDVDDRKRGVNPLAKYFGPVPVAVNHNAFGHRLIGICFDDLGTENTSAMHFGERKNCMEEVLFSRYRNGNFALTHGTTNLSWDGIKDTYGLRVWDRAREMFNAIAWPVSAKSRRA